MRRLVFILAGIILFAGAAGVLAYRLLYEPQSMSATPHQFGGWQIFSSVIDVLNVIVGLIGIGLTITGTRMRRGPMRQEIGGMKQEM
jgi:hypothetical protein